MKKRTRIGALLMAVVMIFSLTTVSFAEAGQWDPLTDPSTVKGTLYYDRTTSTASTQFEKGKPGALRIMPTHTEGNIYYEYVYNASAYCGATATSYNPDVVEVKTVDGHQDIVIGKWVGGEWNGADCLQVNVDAKKAGTATIKVNYHYTFTQNSDPFNHSKALWIYGTTYYTVTVTDTSQQDITLTYDANAGTDTVTNMPDPATVKQTVNAGESAEFTISDATPTRDGYTFLGWADTNDAAAAQYSNPAKTGVTRDTLTTDSSMTIYAVWQLDHQHNWEYVNNGDGTHTGNCKDPNCNATTDVNQPHADDDNNGKCDKCGADMSKPPLDSEPKYEELKPLFDQKIMVEDKVKTGYQHHDTENFGLIEDSYDMTKDNNGQVTVTINAAEYVKAYNAKHAGHKLAEGAADSVQLTLEKASDKWSIVDGKTPVTFEVECNELIPPTEPTKANFADWKLLIKCVTDAHHSSETVSYSQGDYTIDWTKDSDTCTVTFTLDKYVAYYTAKHGEHTAVANQTVTKGFHFANGAWVQDNTTLPEIKVQCETTPTAPTGTPDWTQYLVRVDCVNDKHLSAEQYIAPDPGTKKWFSVVNDGTVPNSNGDYIYAIEINKQAYIDNFIRTRNDAAHGEVAGSTSNVITWKWVNNAWVCQTPDVGDGASAGTKVRINVKCVETPEWSSKYLVQVKCLNEADNSAEYNITKSSPTHPWVTESGVFKDVDGKYTYTITVNKQAYIDRFVKAHGPHAEADGSSNVITLKWENGDWVCTTPTVQSGTDPNTKALINVKCLYTVTFNANGGTPTPDAQAVMHGGFATNPGDPSKEGYEFKGWFEDGAAEAFNFATDVILKNTTLTAQWEAKTDVSYTVKYVHASKVTRELATAKTVTGQTFDSTVTEQAVNIPGYTADAKTKDLKLDAYNKELVFYYTPNQITVSFDANDGRGMEAQPGSITRGFGSKYNNLPTVSRDGYTFLGWFTAADGGKQVTKTTLVTTPNDHTLYAHWEANKLTIVYHGNGGKTDSGKEQSTSPSSTDKEIVIKRNPFTRTGYTFVGWTTEKDGATIAYKGGEKHAFSANEITNGEVHFWAKWKANEYEVTFNANGGKTANPETMKVTFDAAYGKLATTSRDGYDFLGWYTEEDGGTKVEVDTVVTTAGPHTLYAHWEARNDTPYKVEHYQEKLDGSYTLFETEEDLKGTTDTTATAVAKKYDHFTYDSSVDGTVASGTIAGDGSLVLKLYYTRNGYKVTFDSKGGSTIAPRTVKYDQTLAEVDPIGNNFVPTQDGYTFAGWYTDEDCSKEFKFDTKIKSDMTLYAKWDAAKAVNTTTPSKYEPNPLKPSKKDDGKTVKSGDTFDAGISLYVGLGILSLTGSAAAICKRREEY